MEVFKMKDTEMPKIKTSQIKLTTAWEEQRKNISELEDKAMEITQSE